MAGIYPSITSHARPDRTSLHCSGGRQRYDATLGNVSIGVPDRIVPHATIFQIKIHSAPDARP
jgi:hypothetical protein